MEMKLQNLINELDLSLIEPFFLEHAIECFRNKHVMGILICFSNDYGLDFVYDNYVPLLKQDIYEEGLFKAYTGCRVNWSHFPQSRLKYLFSLANKDRLMKIGNPLPHDGPYTLYRGVAGNGSKRRKGGISWTASFEKAKWFATKLSVVLQKPMVYMTVVEKKDVYVFYNGREEQEFLCNITNEHKLKKVWP